ncbi:hypothetical protein EV363DRAFT_1340405 [Boletus edulis]|nr:hypothetical protein EV363DRAFT_1340405 [Boletus edulis]
MYLLQSSVVRSISRKQPSSHSVPLNSNRARSSRPIRHAKTTVHRIPYLYEQAFQWYTSFDPLGDTIERPNPTPALEVIAKVLDHLIAECAWPPHRIHLFGFGQGGSVAAESTLAPHPTQNHFRFPSPCHLGSVVSISGPLLSYPTFVTPCPTPLLLFSRGPVPKDVSTAFSKGFTQIRQVIKPGGQGEESMPRSRDEWEPGDGLYEVMTGTAV